MVFLKYVFIALYYLLHSSIEEVTDFSEFSSYNEPSLYVSITFFIQNLHTIIYYLFKIIIYYQLYSKKVIDAIITLFFQQPFSKYTLDFTTEFINSCSGTKLYLFLEKVLDTKSQKAFDIINLISEYITYGSKNGGKYNNK